MTLYDETHAALDQAKAALAVATKSATADQRFAAAVTPFLVSAGVGVAAAGVAIDKYVAALPPPLMPLVSGLSSEGMSTPAVEVGARICNAYHRDLEPTQGCALPAGNAIDKAIASGEPFRLRLYFGRYSATWMQTLAKAVTMVDTNDPQKPLSGLVSPWWHKSVQDAQAAFLARLAAAYDGRIPLIFISQPMTIFAEPMIRQVGDPATRANLLKAGYTLALDRASFTAAIEMMRVFKQTRVGLAVNPYQYVSGDGKGHQDAMITREIMAEFRTVFPGGVLQNNSLRSPGLAGPYTQVYADMTPPLAFQTATEPRVGDYAKSIEWAIARGAHLVELSPGYEKHLSAAQLADFDQRLKGNA